MTIEQIIAALGLIGIGGIIQSLISFFINSRKAKDDSKQATKEKRCKAIILLSYAFVNYEKEKSTLLINRPNIKSKEELFNELNAEWVNMSLYASDGVIMKMKNLLETNSLQSYNELILEMRKDLYSVKTKLKPSNFLLNRKINFEESEDLKLKEIVKDELKNK